MASGYQQLNDAIHHFRLTSEGRLTMGDFAMQTLVLSTIVSLALLVPILCMCLPIFISGTPNNLCIVIGIILMLILSIFSIAAILLLGARRCHDAGLSGTYQLVALIPYAGPFLHMGLLAMDSVPPGCGYQESNCEKESKIRLDKLKASFYALNPKFHGRMTFEQFARAQISLSVITMIVSTALMIIGYFFMIVVILSMAATGSDSDTTLIASTLPFTIVCGVGITVLFVIQMALMARRLHDTGRSGNNLWWCIFPLIGFAIPMIQCLADSESDNQYGPALNDFEWMEQQEPLINDTNHY